MTHKKLNGTVLNDTRKVSNAWNDTWNYPESVLFIQHPITSHWFSSFRPSLNSPLCFWWDLFCMDKRFCPFWGVTSAEFLSVFTIKEKDGENRKSTHLRNWNKWITTRNHWSFWSTSLLTNLFSVNLGGHQGNLCTSKRSCGVCMFVLYLYFVTS